MAKTIVYIDGQNFLYSVAESLQKSGLISDKQEIEAIDIPYLVGRALPTTSPKPDEIRYYGVSKIKQQKDYGEYMFQKSINFAANLRKMRNFLTKTGVIYVPCGQLRPREVDACKNCGYEDYKFQEKGVDVGLAVDIVKDVLKGEVDHVILVSSDTDLVPAIRIAKEEDVEISYISFGQKIIRPLSVLSNHTIRIGGTEIAEAYANALKKL